MGAVYLVRHEVLDAYFALKVLSAEVAARNKQFIPRFLREAKLCCRIRHPNLVAVYDAGRDDATGLYYLVMDYAPGGSLREMMDAANGALDGARALKIMRELASALVTAAEFSLVHRDIKPENIMFGQKGEAKLADLGIAKASDDSTLVTMANAVFGTPAYMSPEQACDSGKVDARADIYSLGIVFFEMLCGRRPYDGSSSVNVIAKVLSDEPVPDVRTFAPEVSEAVAAVVRDMCEKNADRRIPSAQALLDRLDDIAGSKTAVVRQPSARRLDWSVILSVAVAVCAVAALGVVGWMAFRGRQVRQATPAPALTEIAEAPAPAQPPPPVEEAAPIPAPMPAAPKPVWQPPRPATVLTSAEPVHEAPSAAPVQTPDPVKPGSVVVLGGGKDDASALKSRFGATAFRAAANPARIADQIDAICAAKPRLVYLKLASDASANGMSQNGFDNMIRTAANRLHDAGVPFEFVLERETESTRPYNRLVREVCNSFSYGISGK